MRLVGFSALAAFAADQLSKWAVLHWAGLAERGQIDVFPPYLVFRMGWNTGINFGLFAGGPEAMRWLLVAAAVAISAWLLHWARTGSAGPMALVSVGAVIGGAMGNGLDRALHGAVADFLNMSCCGVHNPFAFNVADIAIVMGAAGLLIFAGPSNIRA